MRGEYKPPTGLVEQVGVRGHTLGSIPNLNVTPCTVTRGQFIVKAITAHDLYFSEGGNGDIILCYMA